MKNEPEIVKILRQEEQKEQLSSQQTVTAELVHDTPEETLSHSPDEDLKESIDTFGINGLQERFNLIFENYTVAITLADEHEKIISWNTYAEQLLNMDENELFMKPVKSLYPAEEWQRIRKEDVRRKGIKYRMETKMIVKNKGLLDVEISLCILHGAQGKNVGSLGLIKDISKLKETERELKKSQERYKTIFENSAVAIMLTDEHERIISWNKYAEHLLQMNADNLFKKPVQSLYPSEQWKKIRSQNVRQKGMQHHLETQIILPTNDLLDVDLSLSVLKDHDGNIIGSIGVIKDITEEKQMKRALEESEKNFKQLYEKAPIPYHALDAQGNIINVNEKWCKTLGYSKEEVIGKPIFSFIAKNERSHAKTSFQRKVKQQKEYVKGSERTYLTKTGESKIFTINDFFSYDANHEIQSIHTTMDDISERKQMEEALALSEKKFKQLYQKAPIAYHTLSPKGTITEVNEKWCKILGYSKKEVVGKSIFSFINKDERKQAKASFQEKIKSGKSYTGGHERQFTTKKGKKKMFVIHDFFSFDDQKQVISIHTTMEDITDRKRTENSLKQSEEKYHAIFELSPQTIFLVNNEGTVIDCNESIFDWLRYKPKEIIGKHISQLPCLPSPSRTRILKHFQQRMKGKTVSPYSLHFHNNHGDQRTGMIYGNVICDREQKIIGELLVISDITERQKAWECMVKSEEKYRVLAETSADGVFTTDALGRLTYVNPSLEKMLGRRKSKILATLFRGYLSENSVFMFQQTFLEVRKDHKKINNVELELVHHDGYVIPIEVNIAPLQKENKFAGLECTVRDITERKRIEWELKKSEQLKTEFMNIAAHELKSPVTPIKGYLELIQSDKQATENIKKWATISMRNAERLLNLVNDILDVSRLDTDTMRFTMEKLDPLELVDNAVEDMSLAAEKKGVSMVKKVPDKLPGIIGDFHRLSQVLKNLLTNAIKFTDNGSITVTGKTKDDQLIITVEDTGIGISSEELPKVFTKFYQAYTGEDRKNEGAGLGLFICREIIKKHNGELTVESQVGQGSTFMISLPL